MLLMGIAVVEYAATINSFFLSDDFALIRAVAQHGPFAVWFGPMSHLFRLMV